MCWWWGFVGQTGYHGGRVPSVEHDQQKFLNILCAGYPYLEPRSDGLCAEPRKPAGERSRPGE